MRYLVITTKTVKAKLPKGISYRKLAKLTGIDYSYLCKVINNKIICTPENARRILRKLKE